METVTSADGTRIAYERTGSGPPLVLVHGSGGDHTRWELFGVRSAFAAHCTVYAMDRRGRGGSGDAAAYALEREFEDVAAVVDPIGEPAVLLGHSYGALCALEAALLTEDLRGLVLYEPPILVGDHLDGLAADDTLARLRTLIDDGENERALVLFLEAVAGLSAPEVDALRSAPNWPSRVAVAPTLYREEAAPAEYEFDSDRFADLAVPTLLLCGSESAEYLRESTEAVARALPNDRTVVFEGHGHVAMNTAPERFVDEVLGFVRSLE